MRIVFGWNNFTIKSYKPKELGLTQEDTNDFRIEARQSYFHLFWIPFFGLGKKWVIRKGSNTYELPAQYQHKVDEQNIRLRTPWYTFAGPLLILAGLIGFWAFTQYDEYKEQQRGIAYYKQKTDALQAAVNGLSDKHILKVSDASGFDDERHAFLKVEKVNGDQVTVVYLNAFKKQTSQSWGVLEEFYNNNKGSLPIYTITKQQLLSSIVLNSRLAMIPGRPGIAFLKGDTIKYALTEAERCFGPLVKDRNTGSFSGGELNMELYNDGWPSQITDLKVTKGDMKLRSTLPIDMPSSTGYQFPETDIRFSGYTYNSPYAFTMEVTDSSGAKHSYTVEGTYLKKNIVNTTRY